MHLEINHQTASLIQQYLQSGRYRSQDDLIAEALRALHQEESDFQAISEGFARLDGPLTPLATIISRPF